MLHNWEVRSVYSSCQHSVVINRVTPSYTWKKDGVTLQSSDGISFEQTDRIIIISELSPSDIGNYTCEVRSGTTLMMSTATLAVLGM